MEVTIKNLESYLAKTYGCFAEKNGVALTENNLFMKLVEEMGEVAEVINKKTGRKADDGTDLNAELGNELCDVIHYAVAIAAVNGLDLNNIIIEKDRMAAIKYNHQINLEEFIRNSEKENV
ncbi:MAG: nucleotide pyrophosphohydrolase [Oscillospiraceae bacterium]|nr:nucleotide pyrophosphohydrolase [Oscillospiraceae bacterium]